MKLFRFLKSKTFWANLVVAIIVCVLIFWGVNAWLDSYTRHGENVKVPTLTRLSYQEALEKLEEQELIGEILDTSEFTTEYPRGSVIEQYPEAGSLVKEGRSIRLTINPGKPRKIEMPQLIEKTKRRAIYDLESKGFEVGELSYVPYIGKDVVVDLKVNGKSVKEKEKFDKGTVVNLVLGQGLGDTKIKMPYLRFLTLEEAKDLLLETSLNLGSVGYDPDLQDTSLALVYKQYPNPSLKASVSVGAEVDIWLTDDYTKIPNDSLKYRHPEIVDSLTNDIDTTTPE